MLRGWDRGRSYLRVGTNSQLSPFFYFEGFLKGPINKIESQYQYIDYDQIELPVLVILEKSFIYQNNPCVKTFKMSYYHPSF